jgi:hypothetical protein
VSSGIARDWREIIIAGGYVTEYDRVLSRAKILSGFITQCVQRRIDITETTVGGLVGDRPDPCPLGSTN